MLHKEIISETEKYLKAAALQIKGASVELSNQDVL